MTGVTNKECKICNDYDILGMDVCESCYDDRGTHAEQTGPD